MRHALLAALLLLAAAHPGCSCADNSGGGNHDGGPDGFGAHGLVVMPPDQTVDVNAGGPPGTAAYKAIRQSDGKDVTTQATWTLDDTSLGTLILGGFTSNVTKGGSSSLHASLDGDSGDAMIHVKLHSNNTSNCPGCPPFPQGMPAPPCAASAAPTIVYPPDGVLVPPNMNVLEVQFIPGTGTTYYEIDFENAVTDVRIETQCNPINDTRSVATGGCGFSLDQATWNYIAQSNRAGDPLRVSVRATTDGTCASPSADRNMSFTEEDLNGGIYYWQSIVVGGVAGKAGGIFRYDFGTPGTAATAYLTPSTGFCIGCHFLSRDGTRMTYGADDADSDDEYGDLSGHLLDVAQKAVIATTSPSGKPLPPGFQTFNHDATRLMASTGQENLTNFAVWDAQAGGAPLGMMPTGMRGTQPDWAPDDLNVVFVIPSKFANAFTPNPYGRLDDDHFLGGSLWTNSYDPASGMFGTPKVLLASTGENNYYPQYSPDTPPSFVIFNRADDAALATDLSKDAFNNPYAKVWLMKSAAGSTPIEAVALNGDPKSTNSWPRWSPFVQMYKTQKLLWVTFSSTRDYGLRVRNHVKVNDGAGNMVDQVNCYPPDSPQNLSGSHTQPLPPNCNQPQLWMAAINLSTAEFATGDPSFPAFWLPQQDVTAHNHTAQWVQKVLPAPCADGGAPAQCIAQGMPCGGNVCGLCCDGLVCDQGLCAMIIP
jgi:hypothetical protein